MFALFDEVPTSTSLLMQCGYRSKVCTSFRATKLDGTLHKLCEFHRRKANENQQRLHQKQRNQRVQRRRAEDASNDRPVKRTRLNIEVSLEIYKDTGIPGDKFYPHSLFDVGFAPTTFTPVDVDILALLLLDRQPLPPNSPTAVEDAEFVVV